jgi:hypothetical protein
MSFLRSKARQLFQAMELVNIDRIDQLEDALERRMSCCSPRDQYDRVGVTACPRDFGDPRVIDFVAFSRRTAFASSGRGG